MPKYAAKTTVASDVTRLEIERTLRRYGADSFGYHTTKKAGAITFEIDNRRILFTLPLPDASSDEIRLTPTGLERSLNSAREAYEQATRQRWRALLLVIKAKLEAIDAGISTIEDEFLAHIVLDDGSTVGQRLLPHLDMIGRAEDLPPLLPAPKG